MKRSGHTPIATPGKLLQAAVSKLLRQRSGYIPMARHDVKFLLD